MAFNPASRQQFAVPASFLTKVRQNRMIYANQLIQQQSLTQGCGGYITLQSGGVAEGGIIPKLLEGARYTTVEERDRILATTACPVASSSSDDPPPPPPPPPPSYIFTEQADSPSIAYNYVIISSDFTTHIASRASDVDDREGPYISIDSGATWTRKVTGMTFAVRAFTRGVTLAKTDPDIMYAANRRNFSVTIDSTYDDIYKSTDRGDNWTVISPVQATWQDVACSYDGEVILACNSNGPSSPVDYNTKMILSTDGGDTWTIQSPTGQLTTVAVNSDGTYLYGAFSTNLRRSSNGGTTWSTTTLTGANIAIVKCSSDGLTVLLGLTNGIPRLSTDGGVTFSAVNDVPSGIYRAIGISNDGTVLAVADNVSSKIWVSTNSGANWYEQDPSGAWAGLDMNSDGTKIGIGPNSGKYYVGELQ